MIKIFNALRSRLLIAAVITAVAACSRDTPEQLVDKAKASLEKREYRNASILVKNALEKKPDSGELRHLLGKILLESGDMGPAEVEFRRALEMRNSRDETVPLLMQVLVLTGKLDVALEEAKKAGVISPSARADVMVWQAAALAARKDETLAKRTLAQALEVQPDNPLALLYDAVFKAGANDFEGALVTVEKVVAKAPANAIAQKLKGDLLLRLGRAEAAVGAYRAASNARPDMLNLHAALVFGLLEQAKTDAASPVFAEAVKEAELLKEKAPKHPQSLAVQARIAFIKRDFQAAREQSVALLSVAPKLPSALLLAGAAEYNLGSYTQAEAHLAQALTLVPDDLLVRRWLVLNRLSAGQAAKAVETITPVLGKIEQDPYMLYLAGMAYIQAGDAAKAEGYFSKSAKLDPDDPRKRTALAVVRLERGDVASGFSDLEQVAGWDKGVTADMALVSAALSRNEPDRALKATDRLEKKLPKDPMPPELRGRVLLAKKDIPGARRSFERALSINPAYMPAVTALAQLDVGDGKLEVAVKRYEAVLANDGKNLPALTALAVLKTDLKAPVDEVVGLYTRAIASDGADLRPRLGLGGYYMAQKDYKKALTVAQEALSTKPDHPDVLLLLAAAQRAAGDNNQALVSYNKLLNVRPDSLTVYLAIAELHSSNKNFDAAEETLKRILKIKPDQLDAQRALWSLNVFRQRFDDALQVARQLQKQYPKDAVGLELEGDVYWRKKAWREAQDAYRAGLRVQAASELAIKWHRAGVFAGNSADSDSFANAWIKDHPKDAAFRFYLAESAFVLQKFELAATHFKAGLAIQPDNSFALNNLAMVALALKLPEAQDYAEKANKLQPGNPAFMDSLGIIVADKGDTARAEQLLTDALKITPDDNSIKFNLARVLVRAGKKADAKKLLEAIAQLGQKFPRQPEVAKMLAEL